MRAFLAAVAVVLAAGCAAPPDPSGHRPAATPSASMLTKRQACQLMLAQVSRDGGRPDIPVLRRVADHVTAPRMAADARTAVRDITHTGRAPVPLALLRDECARAGVKIPAS
jgi:hypothetical protein